MKQVLVVVFSSLSWSRSREPLQPSASERDGVLYIYNPTPADSGDYVCTAKPIREGSNSYHKNCRVTIQSSR